MEKIIMGQFISKIQDKITLLSHRKSIYITSVRMLSTARMFIYVCVHVPFIRMDLGRNGSRSITAQLVSH